jgi:hypothetical protein
MVRSFRLNVEIYLDKMVELRFRIDWGFLSGEGDRSLGLPPAKLLLPMSTGTGLIITLLLFLSGLLPCSVGLGPSRQEISLEEVIT